MSRVMANAVLVAAFVVGGQLVYRLYHDKFATLAIVVVILLVFYRKLDRIEVALSEERRREEFRRRQVGTGPRLAAVVVWAVLCAVGSYAVWEWLPTLE